MTELHFGDDGTVRTVFTDDVDLELLRAIGTTTIARASHVEPTQDGHWTADLGPVRGPVLGPFPRRAQALAAELAWLKTRLHTLA